MNEFTEDSFIIGTMRYSFSRLTSFDTCPYEWHRVYVDCADKDGSAFAQFGSLMHEILEKYVKGELSIFEISQFYIDHFDDYVTCDFPPNKYVDMRDKYYNAGLEYLDNIDLDLERYEVLGVEREVQFTVGKYDCIGFIDLLLRDKETDEIIILDHKSASIKILKNGQISKKDVDHFDSFKKQLYLYAMPILEEYGHVDKLKWNLFREKQYLEIPFDTNEYHESIKWAEDTIKRIESETEWDINPELVKAQLDHKYPPFYCTQLCSQRNTCPYKKDYVNQLMSEREQELMDSGYYSGI